MLLQIYFRFVFYLKKFKKIFNIKFTLKHVNIIFLDKKDD